MSLFTLLWVCSYTEGLFHHRVSRGTSTLRRARHENLTLWDHTSYLGLLQCGTGSSRLKSSPLTSLSCLRWRLIPRDASARGAAQILHDVLQAVNDPGWCGDIWSQIGHVYELKREVRVCVWYGNGFCLNERRRYPLWGLPR